MRPSKPNRPKDGKMNPYSALFSSPIDVVITWASVIVWLGIGTAVLRIRDGLRPDPKPDLCWAAARSFLYLCAILAGVSVIGLVFLAWLRIESPFWLIWQLLWLAGVIAVFQVLPFVCVLLVGWVLVRRWRDKMPARSIFISVACPVGVGLDAALYFALLFALRGRG
jgi:O-antigen/teichoic acid export membrane protein